VVLLHDVCENLDITILGMEYAYIEVFGRGDVMLDFRYLVRTL
jgi:hypothetical protein